MQTPLLAYCVKCKEKRELNSPEAVYTANGRPGTKGRCPVCGGGLFRPGRTEEHAHLSPPPKTQERATRQKKTGKRLVIVESPTKAQALGRFLGKDYLVRASMGHVRDLLRSRLSVDVEDNFRPTYRVPNEKKKVVKELGQLAKKASEVYLATDPDREGEAIAWHLKEALEMDDALPHHRVAFHEVTKGAVEEAFAQPRDIHLALVNAQQARRVLDRLVGYNLSPLLWKNVKGGLSAGRVQSVALRLVVEREREVTAFVPQEYWSIQAELARLADGEAGSFRAELHRINGQEFRLANEDEAGRLLATLKTCSYRVSAVRRGDRSRRPAPPFTTSSLQQEASSRLGFSPARTMRLAQQLYEGIALGAEGTTGLITYMRTDAVYVSPAAQQAARSHIRETFGEGFLPATPPRYRGRTKHAQEAHEAIRPTMVWRTPAQLKARLDGPQWRLYQLIWARFVASQMVPAIYDTVSVDAEAGNGDSWPYLFRAAGSLLKFPGYLAVYQKELKEASEEASGMGLLYLLAEGELLRLLALLPEQHFTQPPPRYTEASLVRELEEKGIGRPSTYAPTLSTLRERGYVLIQERQLRPTELGCVVNDLLVEHFPAVVDADFTAQMEEDLDRIAQGEEEWVEVVRGFYTPFAVSLAQAREKIQRVELTPQYTGELCELCGDLLVVKVGRYGKFIACSKYPTCRNTKPYAIKLGVTCPECGGQLVERTSRRGRTFYGCNNYPRCKFISRRKPLAAPCPACGALLVEAGRGGAQCLSCQAKFSLKDLEAQLAHR